jgi:hypothetical protein
MPIDFKVRGVPELGAEMVKFAQGMDIDIKRVVPIAAYQAAKMGKKLCPPGERLRKIVTRRSGGPESGPERKINEKTDTSRSVRHFVMFMRQNKRPFFVPISPISSANDFQKPTDKQELRDWNRQRNARTKKNYQKPWRTSAFRYQQRRANTVPNEGGYIHKHDSPDEIASMRKIGRRGLAGEVWANLGNKTRGGQKIAIKPKADGVGTVNDKNKAAIEMHAKKWSKIDEFKTRADMRIRMENKLTYITKRYGNIEGRIIDETAKSMENEMKNRLRRRKEAINKSKAGTS